MDAFPTDVDAQAAMVPVGFDRCFGWLHPAAGQKAVILCGALGYEGLCAHQAWRVLAADIAAAGLPVLRFDYDGTGDSLGDDDDGGRLQAWRDSIVAAVGWMRGTLEVQEIALVGLRLGAGLALQAAADLGGVDELVLVAPVVAGRHFVRETAARAALIAAELRLDRSRDTASEGVEVAGFTLSPETVAALHAFDALALPRRPARRTLVLAEPGSSAGERSVAKLSALGCETTQQVFSSFASIMAPPTAPRAPVGEFERIVARLRETAVGSAEGRPVGVSPGRLATTAYAERALFFGPDRGLVGILCEPAGRRRERPCVVFVNGGANSHIGWARSSVLHARRLAALGVASLRMDFGGIGDSYATAEGPRAALYRRARFDDVEAALDCLEDAGFADFAVVGSCSGAHAVLHAAAADARIRHAVMVNLQCFGIPEGAELEAVMRSGHRSMHSFWQSSKEAGSWKRLLSGDIAAARIASIARAMTRRVAGRLRGGLLARLARLVGRESDIDRTFRGLVDHGTRLLFVYSEEDGGRDEFAAHMGQWRRRGMERDQVELHIIAGADHDLTQPWAREQFFDRLCEQLRIEPRTTGAPPDRRADDTVSRRRERAAIAPTAGETDVARLRHP